MRTLLIALIIAGTVVPAFCGIRESSEDILKQRFGEEQSLQFYKLDLPSAVKQAAQQSARQRFFGDFIYAWRIPVGDSSYYAALDNVKGKSLPITFLVVFDSAGNIELSRVVKYREPVGGAVGNESWLRQFLGKNASSGYAVGNDIDGISGATISVYAMSRGIKKLAHIFPFIKEQLDAP